QIGQDLNEMIMESDWKTREVSRTKGLFRDKQSSASSSIWTRVGLFLLCTGSVVSNFVYLKTRSNG
ncbi:MAG: hypothetical protein Q9204_004726, partial [Flavoplaca sp. TL-2023a]